MTLTDQELGFIRQVAQLAVSKGEKVTLGADVLLCVLDILVEKDAEIMELEQQVEEGGYYDHRE